MFNLQGSEIIIVLLLALVVLGPEKLPDAMRKMGQAYAELKKLSSGFQEEFRSVVEEPMREIRETANALRDSADFTKLQAGERDEKPKSGDMAPADTTQVPIDDVPTFEPIGDDGAVAGPALAAESKPAPFSGQSSAAPANLRTEMPTPPPPFTAMSTPEPAEADTSDPATASDQTTPPDAAADPPISTGESSAVDPAPSDTSDTSETIDEADTTR